MEGAVVRGVLVLAVLLVCAAAADAALFGCEIRNATTCLANQTLLIRLNSSEGGSAPSNSHAQLANYSSGDYNVSVCCFTDSWRVLNNTCTGAFLPVLRLYATSDAHVQANTLDTYVWDACLNVTAGNISCEYPNSACTAGYSGVVSIASSEVADSNLTNAHIGEFSRYLRKVCCQIGGLNPPVLGFVNLTRINTTRRNDLDCRNVTPATDPDGDSVTLHYNWYRNGTSITVLNLPMDYPNGTHTNDISGRRYHGSLNNVTFLPTGGVVGGAYEFNGGYSSSGASALVSSISGSDGAIIEDLVLSGNFSISFWIKTRNNAQTQGIMGAYELQSGGWRLELVSSGSLTLDVAVQASGPILVSNATWYHVVIVGNSTNITYYSDGVVTSTTRRQAVASGGYSIPIGRSETYDTGPAIYRALNGTLDEVIIFNRSLAAAEVQTLYNSYNKFLNRSEFFRTEGWNCSITPIDSTGLNGSTVYSNMSTVLGATPSNVTPLYPLDRNLTVFERYINVTWTQAEELDGDTVTYTFNLTPAAGCSVSVTQSSLPQPSHKTTELCVDTTYWWNVTACDTEGCSGINQTFNFSIASVIGLELIANETQFGTLDRGQTKSTDVDAVLPFVVNNTGNVRINITINATNPYSSVTLPNSSYQFRVGINMSNAFNLSGNVTTWTQFNTSLRHLLKQLNYTGGSGANTTASIHINITLPIDEPAGNKQSNVTVEASLG